MLQKIEIIEGEVFATPLTKDGSPLYEESGYYEYVAIDKKKNILYLGTIEDKQNSILSDNNIIEIEDASSLDIDSFNEIIQINNNLIIIRYFFI